ncbi:hypothetical protein [Bdellovibrio bacteriovorus]|uniref:hypothetical protein n=1 Tax=Bdellovibrio bacteriovorus TaxID=959 RepID=UPI0035A86A39
MRKKRTDFIYQSFKEIRSTSMKSKILVRIILMLSLALSAKAETTSSQQNPSSPVVQDLKNVYYWSFYGQYSKDPETLGDVVSRLSDLTSKIYAVSSAEAYDVFKTDILAQGGPQLLLASVGAERVLVGLKLGLTNEVSAFINATHKLNPQLGASLAIMSLGNSGTRFDDSVRASANPMKPGDVDKCLQSCAIYFLGLQNNRFAVDLFAGRAKNKHEYSGQDQGQVFKRFPNGKKDSKATVRTGIDPKVAAASNQCITNCILEVASVAGAGFIGGAKASIYLGGGALYVGLATATVSGAIAGLHCSASEACGKTRTQELQEQEASRLKAENDLREQRLRSQELNRREKEEKKQKEEENRARHAQAKKAQEQKAKDDAAKREQEQKQEEKHKETEKKIRDSYDPSKNKDAKADSSASCEATHTCDGTMNAMTMPDKYREPTESNLKTDGQGNIITPRDMTSTPQSRGMNEDKGSVGKTDAAGNPITEDDMTSMPMKKLDIDSGGSNRDHNGKIVTKRDMTSTPLVSNEGLTGPFNPNKNRGVNVVTLGIK